MAAVDDGPALLRLPAILQNPASKSQRQVEAFNAQQREKTAARRDATRTTEAPIGNSRGKRVVRRMNNAVFLDNPHAVNPRKGDLQPAVPLHARPLRAAFPAEAIERNVAIPSANGTRADPFAPSSMHGTFSTSLKGTRQLLRRKGPRSERLVPVIENAIRGWLGGDFIFAADDLSWRIVDSTEVEYIAPSAGNSAGPSRRVPSQHQRATFPPLPVTAGHVPAVLELSRSAAHLSWSVPDSFDRLVVHMVARYYELISWSEDQMTVTGERIRLTHLIRPTLAKAKAPPASHALATPETSDISGHSASESGTEKGETTDTATEMGDQSDTDSVADYEADTSYRSLSERYADLDSDEETHHLRERFDGLALNGLHRTDSHGSSAYASSEGGSEAGLEASLFGLSVAAGSPVAATIDLPSLGTSPPRRLGGDADWSDKPTFFEFVYGA